MAEDFRSEQQKSSFKDSNASNQQFVRLSDQQQASLSGSNVYLPMLETGQPAIQNDRTAVPADWNLVNIYQNSRDGIVKIVGKEYKVNESGQQVLDTITGSGFFVTSDGKIATDYHVVKGLNSVEVITAEGRHYSAHIENVSTDVDKAHDLALLKIDASPLERFKALPLGDSNFNTNDGVVAIGYPRGWNDMYASPGVYQKDQPISNVLAAKNLGEGEDPNRTVLHTEIHVEPGNSGGPLLSKDGRVIGVIATTDAKPDPTKNNLNVGRQAESTPIDDLVALLNRSQHIDNTMPLRLASTVGLGEPVPYYNKGTTNQGRFGDTLRTLQLGAQDGSRLATETSESFTGRPHKSRFFGSLTPGRASAGFDSTIAASPLPSTETDTTAAPSDSTQVDTSGLKVPEAPRPMHTIALGVNTFNQFGLLRSGQPGLIGPLFSTSIGAFDLITSDFGRLKESLTGGGDVLSSGLRVGADALLIGGGIAGLTGRYRALGSIAALGGSAAKLVFDGSDYYKYFRK